MTARRAAGFTLLEVLIALAVLAVALAAALQTGTTSVAHSIHLRDKTFAHWVALNQAAELQLASAWPEIGESAGESEMGRRHWHWRARTSETADPDLRRVDLSAGPTRDASLATLTLFLPRPRLAAVPP